jgi:hypothetical protein
MAAMRKASGAIVLLALLALPAAEADAARGTSDGVSIAVERRTGTTIRVLRPERRRIVQRGGTATVTCGFRNRVFPPVQLDTEFVHWPRGRPQITIRRLRRGYQFCSVAVLPRGSRVGGQLAAVPFSAAGRAMLDERDTALRVFANLTKVLGLAEQRGGRYPDPATLADRGYHALATPADAPPPEQIGVFSSEAERRIRVVLLTKAGRAVYVELEHDELRTNVPHWLGWPGGF